ncbi:MAG: hypothetical protein ABWY62_07890 [Acidimicrobiia bacterium]
MTMHHHDPDRIMALVAGTLSDAEARLVAAEVGDCEQCSADLDHQRIALAALTALVDDPATALTELESRRLRRVIADQLTPVADAPAKGPEVAGRSGLPWGPLVAVAAVFVALVVGGNAIRSLSPGDDDDASAEIVAADTATTATQSSEAPTAEALTEDTAGGELRQSPATTAAATAADGDDEALFSAGATEATTVGVTLADLALVWEEVTGVRLGSEESATAADAPRLASTVAAELAASFDVAEADAALEGSCVGAAAVAFGSELTSTEVVGAVTLADFGSTVLTVTAAADGSVHLLVHDAASCTVLTEVLVAEHP